MQVNVMKHNKWCRFQVSTEWIYSAVISLDYRISLSPGRLFEDKSQFQLLGSRLIDVEATLGRFLDIFSMILYIRVVIRFHCPHSASLYWPVREQILVKSESKLAWNIVRSSVVYLSFQVIHIRANFIEFYRKPGRPSINLPNHFCFLLRNGDRYRTSRIGGRGSCAFLGNWRRGRYDSWGEMDDVWI